MGPAGLNPISPWRACDTRPGKGTPYSNGPLAGGAELTVALTGPPARPIPFGATHRGRPALVPDRVPGQRTAPGRVRHQLRGGQTIANGIVSKVGPFGNVKIYN